MTDRDYTHYVLLIDRTGSMRKIAPETEAGIAAYVAEQAELPGRATLTLYEFDAWHDTGRHSMPHYSDMRTQVNTVCDFADIHDVPAYKLVPRGNTPLRDAIGMTVTETGEKLAALPENQRPGLVIFVIVTDGLENWSQEWDWDQVKTLITQQETQYGWRFTYLGANQDAIAEAGKMGVHANAAMNYAASSAGTASTYRAAAKWSASTRTAGPGGQSVSYTPDDRASAQKED